MLVRLCNDARLRSWNQPVLSNKGKVSCSRKRTGVFDEARTHYFHITSQTCNTLHHTAPFKYASQFHFLYWIVVHDSFAVNVFERRYSAWNTKMYVYRKLKELWNLIVCQITCLFSLDCLYHTPFHNQSAMDFMITWVVHSSNI